MVWPQGLKPYLSSASGTLEAFVVDVDIIVRAGTCRAKWRRRRTRQGLTVAVIWFLQLKPNKREREREDWISDVEKKGGGEYRWIVGSHTNTHIDKWWKGSNPHLQNQSRGGGTGKRNGTANRLGHFLWESMSPHRTSHGGEKSPWSKSCVSLYTVWRTQKMKRKKKGKWIALNLDKFSVLQHYLR